MLSQKDLGWLAGFLEGEGYFVCRVKQGVRIEVTSVDEDITKRVKDILGFGSIKSRLLPSGKTAYTFTCAKQPQAAGVMMTILPLMGERRSKKIIECLDEWKERKLAHGRQIFCKNGHRLSGDNLRLVYVRGVLRRRDCRTCCREKIARYRSKSLVNMIPFPLNVFKFVEAVG